eukprot:TRINITY_DN2013_c0_g1_i1.p1 TRINITY_DN2013_c0_g1~~TRINITY_DN2013_c0_g1_i1.p1  ORF type:complete len:124 (-),score=23.74 TRINITY_DN2013_c0_g1_i1:68-439(-)
MSGFNRPFASSTPSKDVRGMTNKDILEEQKELMLEQDKGLDDLDNALHRLKDVGQNIGREADESIQIVEDIQKKSEMTDARIRGTSRHVEKIRIQSSTKGLWCVICLLLLALIVLSIVAFGVL